MKNSKNAYLYEHLKLDRVCKSYHEGPIGKMEVVGVERIFSRSIETRRLCFTDYYGDGDSKSFFSVQNIYARKWQVKKNAWDTQKRVGLRLRKLKKTEKGLTKLGLTRKIIDRLQNYYGMAISSNVGDLDTMKKLFLLFFFHVCLSQKYNYHVHCPPGADS